MYFSSLSLQWLYMAGSDIWWWFAVVMLVVTVSEPGLSDPQTNQVGNLGCSPYNVSDVPDSIRERNLSFADLRNQLSSGNKRFATSNQQAIYAMVQCRKYLSTADCVACFDAAVLVTRNCPIATTAAIVIFDGCSLRWVVVKCRHNFQHSSYIFWSVCSAHVWILF